MLISASCMLLSYGFAIFNKTVALHAASQLNLTLTNSALPVIPQFDYRINYNRHPTKFLDPWEFYFLLVQAMHNIGYLGWDYRFLRLPINLGPFETKYKLRAIPLPRSSPSKLHGHHLTMGIYYMGSEQVRSKPRGYYVVSIDLSLDDSDIGVLYLERRENNLGIANVSTLAPASEIDKGANGTGSSSLSIRPAQSGDKFSFTDPHNPQFKISGAFTSGEVEVEALFTASLSVLAQAATHPWRAKGGSIRGTGDPSAMYSPGSIEIIGRSWMTYGQISQTIECIWRMYRAERKFGSLELVVEYLGSQIGNGFVRGGEASIDGLVAYS